MACQGSCRNCGKFSAKDEENITEENNIEDNNQEDRNTKKPIALAQVHPAMSIFMMLTIHSIRKDGKDRHGPSKQEQATHTPVFIHERSNEKQMKVQSFTQHPEVGGEGEVGGDDMENLAPENIAGPDRAEQDKLIPEEPRDVAEDQGEHEVLVHGYAATGKGAE